MSDRLLGKKKYYFYKDPLVIILVVLVFVLLCRTLFAVRYYGIYVVHNSMAPTLTGAESAYVPGGDYLYADRYAEPEHGDIVIVKKDDGGLIIKRVIALSGDRIIMYGGSVYLMYAGTDEFVELDEDYVAEENNTDYFYNTFPLTDGELDMNGLLVPEGYVFVLGDNRDVSNDSRHYGCFAESSVVGVISWWSLEFKSFITSVYTFFAFGVV